MNIKNILHFLGLDDLWDLGLRRILYQILSLGIIITTAFMVWKSFIVIACTHSPFVVDLTGSMEPAFHRGDILVVTNYSDPVRVGEIVVFKIKGRDIPIVHRVIKVHEDQDGNVKFLTKGDNNPVDDLGLYANGQFWLRRKDMVGRARWYIPYIGYVTIAMNEYPAFKFILLGVMGIFVLEFRED